MKIVDELHIGDQVKHIRHEFIVKIVRFGSLFNQPVAMFDDNSWEFTSIIYREYIKIPNIFELIKEKYL